MTVSEPLSSGPSRPLPAQSRLAVPFVVAGLIVAIVLLLALRVVAGNWSFLGRELNRIYARAAAAYRDGRDPIWTS